MLRLSLALIFIIFAWLPILTLQLTPQYWRYGPFNVAYSVTHPPATTTTTTAPLLLLNGFGVGQFYQSNLVASLSSSPIPPSAIYTLDYLGQGSSWPIDVPPTTTLDTVGTSPAELGVSYGVESWAQQVLDFIDAVVAPSGPIAIGGNSIGGHISLVLASRHPSRFSSLILFNATPVWGGFGSKLPSFISSWDGILPAPKLERALGYFLYDQIRDPRNVKILMKECYANEGSYDGVIRGIVSSAANDGGHAAFGSILFSPGFPELKGFYSLFSSSESQYSHLSILGIYGLKDPWIDPRFGRRLFRSFEPTKLKRCELVSLSDVAHCPNSEAPVACAAIASRFLSGGRIRGEETFVESHYDGANTAALVEDYAQSKLDDAFCDSLQALLA